MENITYNRRLKCLLRTMLFCLPLMAAPLALADLPTDDGLEAEESSEVTIPGLSPTIHTAEEYEIEYFDEAKNGGGKPTAKKCNGKTKPSKPKVAADWCFAASCNSVYKHMTGSLGYSSGKAACLAGLFYLETTCQHNTSQSKGTAGNPASAYGICSMESSQAYRKKQGRPWPTCKDISGLSSDIKCCSAVLNASPRYFGPFRKGKVQKCG